jgi:hypothetical protein
VLQRVFSTSPELHIWGENHGIIDDLVRAAQRLEQPRVTVEKSKSQRQFEELGVNGFIASLNPPAARAGGPAARAWLSAFDGDRAC